MYWWIKPALTGAAIVAVITSLFIWKHQYDSRLRTEGALQQQLDFAIKQQQHWMFDAERKVQVNKELEEKAITVEHQYREATHIIQLWKELVDAHELKKALACELPLHEYRELCQHITCSPAAVPVPLPGGELDTKSAVAIP